MSRGLSYLLIAVAAWLCGVGFSVASPEFTSVAPGVEVAPAPGEVLESGQSIDVRLSAATALPAGTPIRVYLDNEDITSLVRRSGLELAIPVPPTLAAGSHRIRLEIPTLMGAPREASWIFQSPAPVSAELRDQSVNVKADANRTLYESDVLEVTTNAPPGGKASATVGERLQFPLRERTAGLYTGTYDIRRTDYVTGAPVRVRVTLPDGRVVGNRSVNSVKVFGQIFTVRIISPTNGSKVDHDFVIKGRTRPRARVSISPNVGVTVDESFNPPRGRLPARRGMGGWDVVADEHGYFEQKFGFPLHFVSISYSFMFTATDEVGQQAIPSTLYVTLSRKKGPTKSGPPR